MECSIEKHSAVLDHLDDKIEHIYKKKKKKEKKEKKSRCKCSSTVI